MSVVAVGTVRDEQDIIGTTVEHLLAEVDLVIVEDHLSQDATPRILEGLRRIYPEQLLVLTDTSPLFDQAGRMNTLARLALERGADWVVPFDADEIWYSPTGWPLRELLSPSFAADVCMATVWEHTPDPNDPGALLRHRHVLPWPWGGSRPSPTAPTSGSASTAWRARATGSTTARWRCAICPGARRPRRAGASTATP